jgi:1,4-alpha-glucan branching enzyme
MPTLSPPLYPRGYLALVLHAHLPYVRHPEHDYFMEENWLYEAMTETYIPLLIMFENLVDDGIPFKITMSMSPTVCSMLTDSLLQERYTKYIDRLIELAEREIERTRNNPAFETCAQMYLHKFSHCRRISQVNLVTQFKALQDKGYLEIITCGATHGYFPVMQYNPRAVNAQIAVAVRSYEKFFDRHPGGIWLPECGYYPGIEKLLENNNLSYFFSDAHGLLFAEPQPKHGVYAPIYCRGTGVAAFARDNASSKAVWSALEGYPGDENYREFYRDIGFDLDFNYIKPYIDPIGIRLNTGIKYYRITGKTELKKPYDHNAALARAVEHARDFLFKRGQQAEQVAATMDRPPIIVAPYDAELFGHWWYEGPDWLNYLIRKIAFEQDTIALVTPSDYLAAHPTNQVCSPSYSSWGDKGYSDVWIDKSNDWIYRHLHSMEEKMTTCAKAYNSATGITRRALNQMARELLLAQASDWAFIMKTGTMVQYAERRTREHVANFTRLEKDLREHALDKNFISLLESHNNIFPEISYRVYA